MDLGKSLFLVNLSMADDHHQEDEDLKLALKMSMQYNPPEPKRSKPIEESGSGSQSGGGGAGSSSDESPEAKSRRLQREIMAAAAEKRIAVFPKSPSSSQTQQKPRSLPISIVSNDDDDQVVKIGEELRSDLGKELSVEESNQLFSMVFGNQVTGSILAQWTNQGIKYGFFNWNFCAFFLSLS